MSLFIHYTTKKFHRKNSKKTPVINYSTYLTKVLKELSNPKKLQKLINHYETSIVKNTPLDNRHNKLPPTTILIRKNLEEKSFVELRYEIFVFVVTALLELHKNNKKRKPTIHDFIKNVSFPVRSSLSGFEENSTSDEKKLLFVLVMTTHVITYSLFSPTLFNANFTSSKRELKEFEDVPYSSDSELEHKTDGDATCSSSDEFEYETDEDATCSSSDEFEYETDEDATGSESNLEENNFNVNSHYTVRWLNFRNNVMSWMSVLLDLAVQARCIGYTTSSTAFRKSILWILNKVIEMDSICNTITKFEGHKKSKRLLVITRKIERWADLGLQDLLNNSWTVVLGDKSSYVSIRGGYWMRLMPIMSSKSRKILSTQSTPTQEGLAFAKKLMQRPLYLCEKKIKETIDAERSILGEVAGFQKGYKKLIELNEDYGLWGSRKDFVNKQISYVRSIDSDVRIMKSLYNLLVEEKRKTSQEHIPLYGPIRFDFRGRMYYVGPSSLTFLPSLRHCVYFPNDHKNENPAIYIPEAQRHYMKPAEDLIVNFFSNEVDLSNDEPKRLTLYAILLVFGLKQPNIKKKAKKTYLEIIDTALSQYSLMCKGEYELHTMIRDAEQVRAAFDDKNFFDTMQDALRGGSDKQLTMQLDVSGSAFVMQALMFQPIPELANGINLIEDGYVYCVYSTIWEAFVRLDKIVFKDPHTIELFHRKYLKNPAMVSQYGGKPQVVLRKFREDTEPLLSTISKRLKPVHDEVTPNADTGLIRAESIETIRKFYTEYLLKAKLFTKSNSPYEWYGLSKQAEEGPNALIEPFSQEVVDAYYRAKSKDWDYELKYPEAMSQIETVDKHFVICLLYRKIRNRRIEKTEMQEENKIRFDNKKTYTAFNANYVHSYDAVYIRDLAASMDQSVIIHDCIVVPYKDFWKTQSKAREALEKARKYSDIKVTSLVIMF